MILADVIKKPITFDYNVFEATESAATRRMADLVILEPHRLMQLDNAYFKQQLNGTYPQMFARRAVLDRILRVAQQLPAGTGLLIFDVFRSINTQKHLWDIFYNSIKQDNPSWDEAALIARTKQFVADPNNQAPGATPPNHNTGGAIDLALFSKNTGKMWDFGSGFDEIHDRSATAYYEQDWPADSTITQDRWLHIRENRRLLFHLMINAGFTNYKEEWWHFDFGNHSWAAHRNTATMFGSLEPAVNIRLNKTHA